MKDESKISYWDFAMTIIIVYLIPVVFIQINVFLMQSFAPEMYSSFKRSDNVIIQHFIDFQFVAYLGMPLFLSLFLGIFKNYPIALAVPLIGLYPLEAYIMRLDGYSVILWFFLLLFSLTFFCHYYVLRIIFANFPKIKKIAYVSMVILILYFLFIITIDGYRYSIDKFGYQYNIDNLYSMIAKISRFIPLFAFVILFIILIFAYAYCWKNRHNIKAITLKGL